MKKRVVVTARDIEQGKWGDPFSCPVARAMSRALDQQVEVLTYSWAKVPHDVYRPHMTDTVADFIHAFDTSRDPFTAADTRAAAAERVKPFRFTVEVED